MADGIIRGTSPDRRGGTLATTTTSGAMALDLVDATDFGEEGGWLVVADSAPIHFDTVDDEADTIALSSAVGAIYEEGLPVDLWDPTVPPAGAKVVEYKASVELANGSVSAVIPHEWIPSAGADNLVGASATIEQDETGQWAITQIHGREPVLDLSGADPDTLPAGAGGGPAAPPAASPTLTTTGFKDAITVEAHGVIDPTTMLDYYIDGVLAETSHSPIMLFRSDAGGVQLQVGTSYTFSVQARNGVLPDPAPSPGVAGALNPAVDSETILGIVKAGFALLGSLTIGSITIKPPSGTPGQPGYDPGGIVIPTTAGPTIKFPADGSAAVIEAILRTADMIVSGGMTINGTTNWLNGRVLLGSGTPDPDKPPTLSSYMTLTDKLFSTATYTAAEAGRGLCQTADGTRWAFTKALTPDTSKKKLVIVNDSDGSVFTEISSDDALLHMVGVTALGNDFYVLGYRWNATAAENQYRIHQYSKSGAVIDQWWLLDLNGLRMAPTVPGGWEDGAIAADNDGAGPGLYVATIRTNYRLRVRQFNPGGTQVGSTWQQIAQTDSPTDWLMDFTDGAFYVGEADYGAGNKRWYIGGRRSGSSTAWGVWAFNLNAAPFTLDTAKDFATGYSISGLTYEGGKFLRLLWSDIRAFLGKFSGQKVDTPIYAKYSWYDSNATGGNKESKASPQGTVTVPKRGWPMFTPPRPPLTGATPDIADLVALYLGTTSGDTNLKRVTTFDGSEGDIALDVFVGTGTQTPLAASTFPPAGSSGSVESLSGKSFIRGNDDAAFPGVDPWHVVGAAGEPAFQNGWGVSGGETLMFRKTPAGDVHITGQISGGSAATVFTLPVGYRPAVLRRQIIATTPFASSNGRIFVGDAASGAVQAIAGSGTPTAFHMSFVFSAVA